MAYSFEELNGKVALITGSGRGIGKGIAEKLADHGCKIIVNDINQETAESTAKELAGKGVETFAHACDISNADQVKGFVNASVEKFGGIDILVNNAGITMDTLFLRMSQEQWQKVIDINLTGTYLVTQSVIKVMSKAKSGNIINISSIARHGNVGQANYSASKAGVIGFTNAIASEFSRRGIRANSVAPGFISTPMTEAMPEKAREAVLAAIPLGRAGLPDDIANAILFLASDLSSYITGQVIDVNGGLRGL